MTRQRYSIKESINRILRSWEGVAIPSDSPDTLSGEILSTDEALSDLAELFENNLPNETLAVPNGLRASPAEALAGTNDTKAITALGLAAVMAGEAHEHGDIHTVTGSVTMVIPQEAWTKVTGSFVANGLSTTNIVPDAANDRVTINSVGSYFIGFFAAFSGSANATFDLQLRLDSVALAVAITRRKLSGSGDVGACSAGGHISVTGTNMNLELYIKSDGNNKNFTLEAGSIYADKEP